MTSPCNTFFVVSILFSIGKPKAAVLPVPVCACPITSFPSKANGIVCSWIGVASSKPERSIATNSSGANFSSLNFK